MASGLVGAEVKTLEIRAAAVRLRDWQTRLSDLVRRRLHTPFRWGEQDCCLWAADVVLACTGVDLAADLRGEYSTEFGARRVLAQHGGVVELAIARLGPVVPTILAQPGDVGLVMGGEWPTLAAAAGGHFLAPGPAGLVTVLPDRVARVWRCTRG